MAFRVLLADDNKTFTSAVDKYLETFPNVSIVGVAHDGRMALTRIALRQPQIVLLDIALPVMSGIDVVQRLRLWPAPPHVILLTMYDDAGYRAIAKDLGVYGLVCKMNFVQELLPIMERLTTEICLGEERC